MSASNLAEMYPGYRPELGFKNEPRFFNKEEFDRLLVHVADNDGADLTIQTEEPAYAYIRGENVRVTTRSMTSSEIEIICNHIYGQQNGVANIRAGGEIDVRHPVILKETNAQGSTITKAKYGFRVNITGCWARGDENGMQITARTINSSPPKLEDMGIEQDLVDNLYPSDGLVLVCGPTGSGKSTLLAGAMRKIIEDPNSHRKIITGEAPIEYTYDDVPRASAIISQHEIPRHLPSFKAFVRNTLRRAPKIILVGETRDSETVEASLAASETGHTVYSTVHSRSVAHTMARLANLFPPHERMTKVFELIESFRVVIVQKLVRRADGTGRVALREYLVFDQVIRDHLRMATSLRETEHILGKMVEKHGQTMLSAAQRAYDAGLIPAHEVALLERQSSSSLIESMGKEFGE